MGESGAELGALGRPDHRGVLVFTHSARWTGDIGDYVCVMLDVCVYADCGKCTASDAMGIVFRKCVATCLCYREHMLQFNSLACVFSAFVRAVEFSFSVN